MPEEIYHQLAFDTRNESLRRFKNFASLGAALISFSTIYGFQPIHIIKVGENSWDLGPVPKEEAWDENAS